MLYCVAKKNQPMKPTQIEEQHFWEIELKRRLEILEAEQQASAEKEKRRLKELHWMHCPKCGQKLATEHHGSVEIDLCPSCRGLWLDANELETIVASESGVLNACLKVLRKR
jgi:uncharacterized protein